MRNLASTTSSSFELKTPKHESRFLLLDLSLMIPSMPPGFPKGSSQPILRTMWATETRGKSWFQGTAAASNASLRVWIMVATNLVDS